MVMELVPISALFPIPKHLAHPLQYLNQILYSFRAALLTISMHRLIGPVDQRDVKVSVGKLRITPKRVSLLNVLR